MNYRFRKHDTILTYKYDGRHHTFKTTKINLCENDFLKFTLYERSRIDSKVAMYGSSKLQIFDKGENRYVLFCFTKQHDLREICWSQHKLYGYATGE